MKKKKEKLAFGRLNLLRGDTLNGNKRIKIGFIGGGPNSFIGYTHRLASRFDLSLIHISEPTRPY